MIYTPEDVLVVIKDAIDRLAIGKKRGGVSRDDLIQIREIISRLVLDYEQAKRIINELEKGGLDTEMTDEENYYFENPEGT